MEAGIVLDLTATWIDVGFLTCCTLDEADLSVAFRATWFGGGFG